MTLIAHARVGIVALATCAVMWVAVAAPVGWYRASQDSYWCEGFGHPGAECVQERRAERWGPFNAWGSNRKSGD